MAYIILSGRAPFNGFTNDEIIKKIKDPDYPAKFESREWRNVSDDAKDFVR